MTRIAGCRDAALSRKGRREGRVAALLATEGWRDKSACHERRKPLTRLGFSCAGGSVVRKMRSFPQVFQWPRVGKALSGLAGALR